MREKLVSTAAAAKRYGCTPKTIREWCRQGKLRSVQIGPRGWHRVILPAPAAPIHTAQNLDDRKTA